MSKAITTYFRALAVIATLLLWGVSAWNGTVKALLLAVFHGRMSDEIPLHTKYTGIPIIDLPIALLVAFFYHGTNGEDEGYNLFLVDAYSTLQSAFVWLYVEMARNGSKPKWVTTPVVFGIMWQCFGAAISLPLYYSIHAPWALAADRNGPLVEAVRDARAIPFSFLLGAICPAVVGMLPTWLGPAYRSARQHQVVLAAWQPDPLWVAGLFALLSGLGSTSSQGKDHSIRSSYRWIRASYVLAAICSATGHILVVAKMASGRADPKLGFTRMYVPFLFGGPAETTGILTRGPFLFLQYDLIIIALSSLSWAYLLYSEKLKVQGLQHVKLAVCMAIGTVAIGPGATVSLTLLARESSTYREFNLQHEKTP